MKISRRGLAGVAMGAAAATQMDSAKTLPPSDLQIRGGNSYDTKMNLAQTKEPDPDYWANRLARAKRIISGDFSDSPYEFDNHTHARMHTNIDALRSISASARQTFIENASNKRRKLQMIEDAKKELDHILGLPFSVTGLFFK